jgi:hypothetical protein
MPSSPLVIEICGEGKSDVGAGEGQLTSPEKGVLPVLIHALCGKPKNMLVKRRSVAFLQGKGWWQKVKFAKQQAYYNKSAGIAFVLDTEGEQEARLADLMKGRDACLPAYPAAVGAPHPCLEAWLLADAVAIARAVQLRGLPDVPEEPESLPAPRSNRKYNPKTELAASAGSAGEDLSAHEKARIAVEIKQLALVRQRCPSSFAPFADEVEQRIKPVFGS